MHSIFAFFVEHQQFCTSTILNKKIVYYADVFFIMLATQLAKAYFDVYACHEKLHTAFCGHFGPNRILLNNMSISQALLPAQISWPESCHCNYKSWTWAIKTIQLLLVGLKVPMKGDDGKDLKNLLLSVSVSVYSGDSLKSKLSLMNKRQTVF